MGRSRTENNVDEVSVTDLKHDMIVCLELVESGRTLTITSQRKPIAVLAPIQTTTSFMGQLEQWLNEKIFQYQQLGNRKPELTILQHILDKINTFYESKEVEQEKRPPVIPRKEPGEVTQIRQSITQEDIERLKPCPFCNSKRVDFHVREDSVKGIAVSVQCYTCSSTGSDYSMNLKGSIKTWLARKLQDMIDALKVGKYEAVTEESDIGWHVGEILPGSRIEWK